MWDHRKYRRMLSEIAWAPQKKKQRGILSERAWDHRKYRRILSEIAWAAPPQKKKKQRGILSKRVWDPGKQHGILSEKAHVVLDMLYPRKQRVSGSLMVTGRQNWLIKTFGGWL